MEKKENSEFCVSLKLLNRSPHRACAPRQWWERKLCRTPPGPAESLRQDDWRRGRWHTLPRRRHTVQEPLCQLHWCKWWPEENVEQGVSLLLKRLMWPTREDADSCASVTYLSLVVCGYSTHIVMNSGQDGDGLLCDVHSGKDHGCLWDARQPCGQLLGREVVKLQVHMVLLWTDAPEGIKAEI